MLPSELVGAAVTGLLKGLEEADSVRVICLRGLTYSAADSIPATFEEAARELVKKLLEDTVFIGGIADVTVV